MTVDWDWSRVVFDHVKIGVRDAEASRTIDEAMKVSGISPRFVAPYAIAAMPARYAFERGAWQEGAKLQPSGSTYPFVEAITYFSRSVGAARSGSVVVTSIDRPRSIAAEDCAAGGNPAGSVEIT